MRIGVVQYALRLTAVLQVYGGGVSFVVHPYVWSSSTYRGGSSASAGSTIVTGLSIIFIDCNFSGGTVSTRTISAPTHVFFNVLFLVTVVDLVLHSCSLLCSIAGEDSRVAAYGSDG